MPTVEERDQMKSPQDDQAAERITVQDYRNKNLSLRIASAALNVQKLENIIEVRLAGDELPILMDYFKNIKNDLDHLKSLIGTAPPETVAAKFIVTNKFKDGVVSLSNPDQENDSKKYTVHLNAVIEGSEENKMFFASTPSGIIDMCILNDKAAEYFENGKEYYATFLKA